VTERKKGGGKRKKEGREALISKISNGSGAMGRLLALDQGRKRR